MNELRAFEQKAIREAKAYALAGGQALHLHRFLGVRSKAPRCFVQAWDRGERIAHLFDQDAERLKATARKVGVKVVCIEHPGTDRQHIDFCGAPLRELERLAALNGPEILWVRPVPEVKT